MSTDPIPSGIDGISWNASIGPQEVGVIVGAWMFGCLTVQVFNYYQFFPNDSKRLRIAVGLLWVLELVHVILTCTALWNTTVTHFGDGNIILFINTEIGYSLVISTFVGPGVQIFFAHRVRVLSGRWLLPIMCWCLSLVRAATLLGVCAASQITPFIPDFKARWDWLVLLSLSVSTSVDIVIAVSLCVLLWQRRTRSSVKSTQKAVDTLLAWTINTGMLTSFSSILMLVFFVTMDNFAWLCMMLIIPRLFANSMVASLNSRTQFRAGGNTHLVVGEGGHGATTGTSGTADSRKYPSAAIAIEMSRTREVVQDPVESKIDFDERRRDGLGLGF